MFTKEQFEFEIEKQAKSVAPAYLEGKRLCPSMWFFSDRMLKHATKDEILYAIDQRAQDIASEMMDTSKMIAEMAI